MTASDCAREIAKFIHEHPGRFMVGEYESNGCEAELVALIQRAIDSAVSQAVAETEQKYRELARKWHDEKPIAYMKYVMDIEALTKPAEK